MRRQGEGGSERVLWSVRPCRLFSLFGQVPFGVCARASPPTCPPLLHKLCSCCTRPFFHLVCRPSPRPAPRAPQQSRLLVNSSHIALLTQVAPILVFSSSPAAVQAAQGLHNQGAHRHIHTPGKRKNGQALASVAGTTKKGPTFRRLTRTPPKKKKKRIRSFPTSGALVTLPLFLTHTHTRHATALDCSGAPPPPHPRLVLLRLTRA